MTEDTIETGRIERLSDAVASIRGGRRMDPDRALLLTGGILAVLGLVAIVIGWYGSAHTAYSFEQMPYLISGGLLGVALVFLGGFVYFAYWVTRLVRESREQSQRAADLLEQISFSLNGHSNGSAASSGSFVATRGGNLFHRPDCRMVSGKSGLRKVTAQTRGLEPCGVCDPLSS